MALRRGYQRKPDEYIDYTRGPPPKRQKLSNDHYTDREYDPSQNVKHVAFDDDDDFQTVAAEPENVDLDSFLSDDGAEDDGNYGAQSIAKVVYDHDDFSGDEESQYSDAFESADSHESKFRDSTNPDASNQDDDDQKDPFNQFKTTSEDTPNIERNAKHRLNLKKVWSNAERFNWANDEEEGMKYSKGTKVTISEPNKFNRINPKMIEDMKESADSAPKKKKKKKVHPALRNGKRGDYNFKSLEDSVLEMEHFRGQRIKELKDLEEDYSEKKKSKKTKKSNQSKEAGEDIDGSFGESLESELADDRQHPVTSQASVTKTNNIRTREDIIQHHTEWMALSTKEQDLDWRLIGHVAGFMNLKHPTVIQAKSIPHILNGSDLLMKSETGSGKTLAYLIPVVSECLKIKPVTRKDGIRIMVIAPTRELVIQIMNVAKKLCKRVIGYFIIGNVMGGEKPKVERKALKKGLVLCVATPGRLLDHLENTQNMKYDLIQWLILDEADILLHLGFENFIRSIIRKIDAKKNVPNRQNILVSATLDARVCKLAKFILNQHVFVAVNETDTPTSSSSSSGNMDHHLTYAPATLEHHYIQIRRSKQSICLIAFLRYLYWDNLSKLRSFKVIVFMSTCSIVHFYYTLFRDGKMWQDSIETVLPPKHSKNGKEIPWFELYGDMTQKERTAVFFKFKDATNGVLLCTDVASRATQNMTPFVKCLHFEGPQMFFEVATRLDIPTVNFIIQYDPPSKINDYIHRSGRTARMGRKGKTFMFLTPPEVGYIEILRKHNFKFSPVDIGQIWHKLNLDYKRHLKRLEFTHPQRPKVRKQRTERMDEADLEYDQFGGNRYDSMMRRDSWRKQENEEKKERPRIEEPEEMNPRDAMAIHWTNRVMDDEILEHLARDAMRTFISAYSTYPPELRSVFYVKNLDFNDVADCFFVDRDKRIKRGEHKTSKEYIQQQRLKRNRYQQDKAQKLTKKRRLPNVMSEFAS